MYTLLLKIVLSPLSQSATAATGGILLQKHACVAPSTLSASLNFFQVATNSQCAILCFAPSCAGVAIDDAASGKQCALLAGEDLPAHGTQHCGLSNMTVTVFRDQNVPQCAGAKCVRLMIWVHGTCHCLNNLDTSDYDSPEALRQCVLQYGPDAQLPEAATISDLDTILTLSQSGGSQSGRVWLGAIEGAHEGIYVWPSGNAVNASLWIEGQPDRNNSCTQGRLGDAGVVGMADLACGNSITRNTVCSVPDCSGC